MTENAAKFITPLTLREITGNPVTVSMWNEVTNWHDRYPQARIIRLDQDTTVRKNSGDKIIEAFRRHVVEAFLKRHPEFKPEKASDYCSIYKEGSYIQLLPQIDNLDGFFIARLRRGE